MACAAQKLIRLGDQRIALTFFSSDGHQADSRRCNPKHDSTVVAAENCVVDQVFRLCVRIGAGVDQNEMSVFPRYNCG